MADTFGGNEVTVRRDLIKPLFGYDEFSIADVKVAERLSAKARTKIRKFERYWQDIMQIAKTNIVIKGTEVLAGNIMSNAKILGYVGVNPVKGVKLMLLGASELKRYENDKRELGRLEREKLGAVGNELQAKSVKRDREIEIIRSRITNNTVTVLIEDMGVYQSIVDDVSIKQDTNKVAAMGNNFRDKVIPNQSLNTFAQYMFLTEKTAGFQQMLKATQVSDFYFRYAQYYDALHNKGHSPEKAKRNVIDNYINYEAPLNNLVKYGDRMGPFFFITYFTRIQRVVKRIAKTNPARVAADITQQFMLGDQDDILDQSALDANVIAKYNPLKVFGNLWEAVSPSGVEIFAKLAPL